MEYVKGISLRDYYQRCHRRICEKEYSTSYVMQ